MSYYNPTKQTQFDNNGNCLSAVIATLFDVNINEVPFFNDDEKYWCVELSNWMVGRFNKYVVPIKLCSFIDDVHIFGKSLMITSIDSPNPKVDRHAVITKGNKVVFDPMIGEVDRELNEAENPTFMAIGNVLKIET